MNFLLINTCGEPGVVAIAAGGGIAVETMPGRGTSETLIPTVRRLLGGGIRLDGVGVVDGPGSFTGVRVGLSAAKGLCDALGVGLVAMSRLELVAGDGAEGEAVALLDAGRGEYYCGVYRRGLRLSEEILGFQEVRELIEGREALTCEARVAERLGVKLVQEPGAKEMLKLVQERVAAGKWSDVGAADANYLRRTDAELLKAAK